MTRRQMIALFTVPSLMTSIGIASVQLSGASPQAGGGSCCDPGCCVTGAGTAMVAAELAPAADPGVAGAIATGEAPATAPASSGADWCDPGSCCVTSCETESK